MLATSWMASSSSEARPSRKVAVVVEGRVMGVVAGAFWGGGEVLKSEISTRSDLFPTLRFLRERSFWAWGLGSWKWKEGFDHGPLFV